MKIPGIPRKRAHRKPTCLAELDFQILCQSGGKEKAIRTMMIIAALRKEKLAKKTTT